MEFPALSSVDGNGFVSAPEDLHTVKSEEADDVGAIEKAETRVTYNVIFVTSEAAPYSKTGGLGDVCGSLPIALAARGHRVMVVSPRYLNGTSADENYAGAVDMKCPTNVNCFGGIQEVGFFHEYRKGVDWVTILLPAGPLWMYILMIWLFYFGRIPSFQTIFLILLFQAMRRNI